MTDRRRRRCMACGKTTDEVGLISWRGNCAECGMERAHQSVSEQLERRGPMYRRWQSRLLASVASMPLDVAHGSEHTDGHA